mgnify:CR=1 FL=1
MQNRKKAEIRERWGTKLFYENESFIQNKSKASSEQSFEI